MRVSSKCVLTILLSILLGGEICAQTPPDSVNASYGFWSRHNLATVTTATLVGGMFVYGAGVWWVNDFRSFRFWTAPHGFFNPYLEIDKVGHAYTGYYIYHAVDDILLWGGRDTNEAFWWATGLSAFHAFMVEVGDGFSEWGFDYRDMLSNWTGITIGVLQEKVPVFRNLDVKWSLYYPLNRHAFIINDLYDYHIYWLSFKVNNFLPQSVEPYWPDWLQVAFGYSSADHGNSRDYILSFDYNLEMIPIEGTDINLVKKLLNMFHAPAPGVKFFPGRHPEFQLLLLN